ncbi:hypothetical protein DL96DRAFT_1590346 [Flagelloscypha sp. PMI_526]|nr:hypothetical protein DL96DRAFT_1590346 [Flagelloscypha sp. PMI_526]
MSLPTVPFELLEKILSFTSNRDARSCALTCHALLYSFRANIFSHVRLSNHKNYAQPDAGIIPRLFDLLMRSPHIAPFIHHLSLIDLNETAHQDDCPRGYLVQLIGIFDQLHHLQSIYLIRSERYYGCYWKKIPQSIKAALYNLFVSETIRTVSAQLYEESPDFLEHCPRLKHLHIMGQFKESLTCTSNSVSKIVLQSLRFTPTDRTYLAGDIESILGKGKDSILDLSQLQTLALDPGFAGVFDFGPWIAHIAIFCASSLTELFWEFHLFQIVSQEIPFPLSRFPNLQTLVLVVQGISLEAIRFPPCEWIQKFIESRIPCVPLVSSTITLPWSDDTQPLQTLIRSGIQGTQRTTFSFTGVSEVYAGQEVFQKLFESLRSSVDQQVEADIRLIPPLEPFNPFDGLGSKGEFIR